jgi:hypothetical protein
MKEEIVYQCPYAVCNWPNCLGKDGPNRPLCGSQIEIEKREVLKRFKFVPSHRSEK